MTAESMGLSPHQLEVRRQGIGASEIGAVLGLDTRRTPFDIWASKTQPQFKAGGDDAMALFGHLIEPVIAKLYQYETGASLVYLGDLTHRLADTIALATPDYGVSPATAAHYGLSPFESLVQCKSRDYRTFRAFGEPGTDQVPAEIGVQVQWEAMVLRVPMVHVAVLVDRRLHTFHCEADKELQAILLERGTDWWETHVVKGVQPPLAGVAAEPYLRKKFALVLQDVRRATTDEETEALALYARARRDQARAMELEAAAKLALCELVGHSKGLENDAYRFLWSPRKGRVRTDWEAVAKEYRTVLELVASHMADDVEREALRRDIPAVVQKHTTTGEPSRSSYFTDHSAKQEAKTHGNE